MDEKEKRQHLIMILLSELDYKFNIIEGYKTYKFLVDNNLDVKITKSDKKYLHKVIDYEFLSIEKFKSAHKFIYNLPSNLNKYLKYRGNGKAIYKRSGIIPTILSTALAVLLKEKKYG